MISLCKNCGRMMYYARRKENKWAHTVHQGRCHRVRRFDRRVDYIFSRYDAQLNRSYIPLRCGACRPHCGYSRRFG